MHPYLSKHAQDRMTARNIPPGIVDLLLEYGETFGCRDGGTSHRFSAASFAAIKRHYGPAVTKALAQHRDAYVVCAAGRVLTAAHSKPGSHGSRRAGRAS